MTWIGFILKAQTQYNIHSPFVFELYRNALFARTSQGIARQLGIKSYRNYYKLLYRLLIYFKPTEVILSGEDETAIKTIKTVLPSCHINTSTKGPSCLAETRCKDFELLPYPHTNKEQEKTFIEHCEEDGVTASIDMYYAGLIFRNPRLSRQHFLLRSCAM